MSAFLGNVASIVGVDQWVNSSTVMIRLPKGQRSPMAPPPSDASFLHFHIIFLRSLFVVQSLFNCRVWNPWNPCHAVKKQLKHHRTGLNLYEHILVLLQQDAQVLGMILFMCTVSLSKWQGRDHTVRWWFGTCFSGFKKWNHFGYLLLMEEILHHLGCIKPRNT